MIRNILVIIIGWILWFIFLSIPFTFLMASLIERKINLIFLDIYLIASFLPVGIFVGWFGRAKGWLLALIFSVSLILVILYGSSMGREYGSLSDFKILLEFKIVLNIVAAMIGGYIGEKFFRKRWPLSINIKLRKNSNRE